MELSSQSLMFAKHSYHTQMGAALCIYRSHHNIMMCNLLTGFQKMLRYLLATHGMRLHWYVDAILRILECLPLFENYKISNKSSA